MFFVLVLSAAFASFLGPAYDEVLIADPTFYTAEVAPEHAWEVSAYTELRESGVIDLVELPPLMPARAPVPTTPIVHAASAVAAVSVEARTRE